MTRVLVVDDEENLVWSLRQQFELFRPDLTFEGFTDPLEALERLRSAPPDVLITDVRMPKMSGIELLVAARSVAPTLPVIIFTAYGGAEVLSAVKARTSVEYFEKPVRFEILVAAVDRLRAQKQGFSGSISLPLLPDLLQIYTMSMISGVLRVQSGEDSGTIWFARGEIVDAVCGPATGAEAIYELLTWQQGEFSFDGSAIASRRTINLTWQGLLLEGCRRLDERQENAAARAPAGLSAEQASSLLARIRAELPGFIAAAILEPPPGRTLGMLSSREDFDPRAAASLDGAVLQRLGAPTSAGPSMPIQDILFTLSDQLHFLRRIPSGELLFLATESSHSTNLALVRSAVSRQLRELDPLTSLNNQRLTPHPGGEVPWQT